MTRILFVCHGNICRSTMAQFVMEELVRRAGRDRLGQAFNDLHAREQVPLQALPLLFPHMRERGERLVQCPL